MKRPTFLKVEGREGLNCVETRGAGDALGRLVGEGRRGKEKGKGSCGGSAWERQNEKRVRCSKPPRKGGRGGKDECEGIETELFKSGQRRSAENGGNALKGHGS